MREECRIEYVKLGLTVDPNKYEALLFSSAIWGALGIASGILLGGKWLRFSIAWLAVLIMILLFGFYLIRKKHTVKTKMSIQVLIYASHILQLSLLQGLYFVMAYGIKISLIFLYLPVILNPIILSVLDYRYFSRKWNKDFENSQKSSNFSHNKSISLGTTASCLGLHLAAMIFSDINQNTALLIMVIFLEVLNLLYSIGLTSIQRLYLIHSLKRSSLAKKFFE